MEISEETEEWLRANGYQYYCFISYPKIHEDIRKFALCVKEAIEKELVVSVDRPKVFLDDKDISLGTGWKGMLSGALCRSVAMVALCLSAYYRKAHGWCGLEWAAMEALGAERLAGYRLRPIVPIMLRLEQPIPETVLDTQYVEMTAASLTWEQHCQTIEFKEAIHNITAYIGAVAEAIASNGAGAGHCGEYIFPGESAFAGWKPTRQEFPLHLKK